MIANVAKNLFRSFAKLAELSESSGYFFLSIIVFRPIHEMLLFSDSRLLVLCCSVFLLNHVFNTLTDKQPALQEYYSYLAKSGLSFEESFGLYNSLFTESNILGKTVSADFTGSRNGM